MKKRSARSAIERLAEIQKKAARHAAEDADTHNNVVQLPLWPEPVRAVPNGFLRSALFGAIRKGRRRYLKAEQLAALDGIEIRYTGERLDQGDLDVWLSVLHATRMQGLGNQCRVTSYALLKLMGKTSSGKSRAILHKRIERLVATALTIQQGRYTYIGSLISEAYKDEETHEWVIVLNKKLQALFAADQFTNVEWSIRRALAGKPLAQWLYSFYSSHAKPFPIKVETLHRLCGSEAKTMRFFAVDLRKNLEAIAQVCADHGQEFSYEIDGGLVYVEKCPSPAQARHLSKKSKR
jgi:hypothetical protein